MINETPTAKLTDDENVIYHIVQEAGKEGIRSADVAKKCKKATSEATKILNNLQHLGYIQSRKLDGKQIKKWYHYDIELNPQGQASSTFKNSSGEFQESVINILCSNVIDFLENSPNQVASIEQIGQELKARSETLENNDIIAIIDLLLFDSKIVQTRERDKYRLNQFLNRQNLAEVPCLKCPVIHLCRPGQAISPENCIYFLEW